MRGRRIVSFMPSTYGYINLNATRSLLSKTEVLMNPTGPGAAGEVLLGQTKTSDAGGRQVVSTVYANRAATTRRSVSDPNDSTYNAEMLETNGLMTSRKGTTHSWATTYGYDALGRSTSTTDPRSGVIDSTTYDASTG